MENRKEDTFFTKLVAEMMSPNKINNEYTLERYGDTIDISNGIGRFYETTEVTYDEQFKAYYDMLEEIFGDNFRELVLLGYSNIELKAIINGNIITFESDNDFDRRWIFEKTHGTMIKTK